MHRLFTSTLVALLGLVLVGTVHANGPRSGSNGSSGARSNSSGNRNGHQSNHFIGSFKDYHLTHGTKASFGFFYRGHNHHHWSHRYWNDRYGCYCYFCPYTSCYYYWCAPDNCYYPVTYSPYGSYAY